MKVKISVLILVIATIALIVYGQYTFTNKTYNVESTDTSYKKREKIVEENAFSEDNIYIQVNNDEVKIYIKGSNTESDHYLGYQMKHLQKELDQEEASSNYDIWKLNGAHEYSRSKSDKFRLVQEVVRTGEWEMAFWERGATDFVGGSAHGDEVMSSVEAFIDGEQITLDQLIESEATEFVLSTTSDIYRDNTITEDLELIGNHKKVYTFNKEGLSLEQEVEFKEDLLWYRPYLTMLPILRSKDDAQVTDTYEVNGEQFDVSEAGFEEQFIESEKAKIWSEESGITATIENKEKSLDTPTIYHVANSPDYNKLYFAYVFDDNKVNEGDVWSQTTKFTIDTIN